MTIIYTAQVIHRWLAEASRRVMFDENPGVNVLRIVAVDGGDLLPGRSVLYMNSDQVEPYAATQLVRSFWPDMLLSVSVKRWTRKWTEANLKHVLDGKPGQKGQSHD